MSLLRSARLTSSLLGVLLLLVACGQAAAPTAAPTTKPAAQATTAPAATTGAVATTAPAATKPAAGATAATAAGATTAPAATTTGQAATGKEILIGLSAPMSGGVSQNGKNFSNAVNLAIDDLNKAGGINTRPVRVVEADDRNDPKEAANIAQKFASDPNIMAVLGGFSSTASLAAAPIYQQNGVVQLCPSCSHREFTKDGEYIFSMSNPQSDEQPRIAQFTAETLGKKKIAIVWRKDDWGLDVKETYEKQIAERGGTIVLSEGFTDNTQDFKPVLTKIKGLNPDVIYVALFYNDASVFAQQAKQLAVDLPLVSTGSLYNVQFLNLAQGAADGMYLPTTYFPDPNDPKAADFARRYKERFGIEADNFAAHAYDSIQVLFEAMKKSDLTRKSIRDALAQTKGYKGLTGEITFDENRRVHKEYTWLQVKNNQFTLYRK